MRGSSAPEPRGSGASLPGSSPRPGAVLPWVTLLALASGHFAVDCCTGIWPVFKTLAGLDLAKAGLIATIGSMASNGLQVLFGTLADRGWRKRLLVGGAAAASAITLVPWVGSYSWMFALQLTTALGSAAFHPSATGAAGEISRTRTGVMIGLFLAGGYLGYAFSQLLFSAIYVRSPHWTPVILLVPLAAIAGITLLLPETRPAVTPSRSRRAELRPHLGRLVPLFLVQVFATAANQSLIFLLPDLMISRGAPGWMVNGGGHFGLVAGSCLALLPAGHAADRWGARRVLIVGNAATGILLALLLGGAATPSVDLALVTAIGLFNGVNTVVTVSEGNRMLPGQASGVSSLLMGLPWCVAAIAPVAAGVLAEPTHGGSPVRALSWLGLAIPLAFLASLAVRRRVSSS